MLLHADTWQAGDDPGGGSAPVAGLFLPGRGFGKVWREDQRVRDCLGYALTPAETAYTMSVQPFQRYTFQANLMLSAATPEGDVIYTIYQTFLGSSACISRPALCRPDYQRYPAPSR